MIIVNSHHKVLAAWAEYRNTLAHAPRLITLDHHTDTSQPFRNYIKKLTNPTADLQHSLVKSIDYKNPSSIDEAIEKLSNDEHVTTAIKANIISSAFVVAHNAYDTDLETYREHKIICRSVDRNPLSKKLSKLDYDKVLETDFLNTILQSFDRALLELGEESLASKDYILDIDLDYFNTFNSVVPQDSKTIKSLVQNAGLITIATEPDYVLSCAQEPGLSSEFLLKSFEKLIL